MKVFGMLIVLFVSFISLMAVASAFGVSSSYTIDTPLTVYPGETKEVQLTLLPGIDGEDVLISAEILDDQGIARLVDEEVEYFVTVEDPAVVNIRLKVPRRAIVGEEYAVELRFTDITPSDQPQMVAFQPSSVVFLKASVVEAPPKEISGIVWIVLLLVLIAIVAVVIWFVMRYRKKESKKL
jgi:hypothetical protein